MKCFDSGAAIIEYRETHYIEDYREHKRLARLFDASPINFMKKIKKNIIPLPEIINS